MAIARVAVTFLSEECLLVPHNLLTSWCYRVAIAGVRVVLVIKVESVHVVILHQRSSLSYWTELGCVALEERYI